MHYRVEEDPHLPWYIVVRLNRYGRKAVVVTIEKQVAVQRDIAFTLEQRLAWVLEE